MSEIFEKALSFGTGEKYSSNLNGKIRTANLVSYGLFFIATAYSLFSLEFFPPLTYLPVMGFFLIGFGMLMGYLELHFLYRVIISLVPTFIVTFYHRGLLVGNESPLSSMILLQGAFSLLPFLLFDLKEKKYLFLSGGICIVAIIFFRYTEGWLDYGLNDAVFRTGVMHELTVVVAMAFLCGAVLLFAFINQKVERQSAQLLTESKLQNKMLQDQQDETQKNIAKLEEAQSEERKRAWISQGISDFNGLMRKANDLDEMYDQLVAGIVKYVGVNQAGLYLVEGDGLEAKLKLKSCYAYSRKKYQVQEIKAGEGLAGQVYLEKEYVYMTEVPQGYVRIKSGLGDATPSSLLIVPLMQNDKVEGVLELASFHPIEKHIIDFLVQLGEDIAASINMNQINETTRILLKESQEQAESMRAQEEELRQNMEELSATQEEMKRKEVELSGQVSAINSLLATIEFNLEGNVLAANQVFLETMGYQQEEIIGRHHKLFVEEKFKVSAEYKEFWSRLRNGEILVGEYKRVAKSGKTVWLKATYTPVRNAQGELVKVMKIASDITEQKMQSIVVESHFNAMNKSNAIVEFDMQGNILDAHEVFLKLMNYALPQVLGKHHSIFVSEEDANSADYRQFWQKLRAGEFVSGEFCRCKSDGSLVWIYGSYNPVLDGDGVPYKVVKYAQDISKWKNSGQLISEEM